MATYGNHINEMCQLIYYDFTINDNIDKFLERADFFKVGKDYNTIAIIGAQSSGKSTLLNKLFDTNFDVMSSSVGRGQTTKGVWTAAHTQQRVLIFDCEGTDSKERGEERHKFEHCSSLFCLAMTDVLIINMWTNDVGRYTASNYGVLKIVFEMNLKLFQQECAKKILIVLRDFDHKRNQKSKIQELILRDIQTIWDDIKKPEKYRYSDPSHFFEFEFVALPHKKYCEEQFNKEVQLLRSRLNPTDEKFLFKHSSTTKNVPADGLKQYIQQLWSDILNEKDLNLPSQKEMLANYRCNEIKSQVLQENEGALREFYTMSIKGNLESFKELCLQLYDKILSQYDMIASNYVEKIYQSVRNQLKGDLYQKFLVCFHNQANRMIPISQKYMRHDLQIELKNNGDNFYGIAEKLKIKYLNFLINKLNDKKVFDLWNIRQEEYSDIYDEIVENQKKLCLDEKRNHIVKTIKREVEESFISKIQNFSNKFWFDLNFDYFNFMAMKMFPLKRYLRDYYRMSDPEVVEFALSIEMEVYTNIKRDILKKTKEISSITVELFKKRFWYEKEDSMRKWNRLEDEEIDDLFKKCRNEYIDLFDNFKVFKLIKTPLKYLQYDRLEPEDLQISLQNCLDLIPKLIENENFEPLMRQNEISTMKRKFDEGVTSILEDAKRRREGLFTYNLPWWGWTLIIFFGFDDFLPLVSSMWIVPILLLISSFFLLNHLNMTHVVKNVLFDLEDAFMEMKTKIIPK